MAAITIRFEPVVCDGDRQTVAARIDGVTDAPYRLWYAVPSDDVITPVAMAHAFLVSVINQAMAVGRDIDIDAPVPRGLAINLDEYQRAWCTWKPDMFRRVGLRPSAFVDDEPFRPNRGVILSFSGGLDSSYSALLLAESKELAALATIHGLDFKLAQSGRFANLLRGLREMARSLGVPLLAASTNWQEVMPGLPGYLGFFGPVLAVPILLSDRYGYAVASSAYSYDRQKVVSETNPISDPLLGRPGFPIRHYGAWARRIHKVAAIASWPEALQYLRPCEAATGDGAACGTCRKCIQTALTFHGLGFPVPPALRGAIPPLEAIAQFEMSPYAEIGLQDAVAAAKARGATDPWIAAVERRLQSYADLPTREEYDDVKARLDYVLGGNPQRWGLPGLLLRLTRALRGRDDPRG